MECGIGTLDDLFHFIMSEKVIYESLLKDIYTQIMSQLDMLQEHCICHRDLKPSNVIITKGMKFKFADFGLSEKLNKFGIQEMSYRGTVEFMSPELLEGAKKGTCMIDPFKADLFATEKIMVKASEIMDMKFRSIDKEEFERMFKDDMNFRVYKKIKSETEKEKIITFLKEYKLFHEAKVKLEKELNFLRELEENKEYGTKRKAKILDHLGEINFIQADHLKAWECYFEGHQHKLMIFPETSLEIAQSYDNLGKLLQKEGTYEDALESFKSALDIKTNLFGPEHPTIAASYNNLGGIYYDKEDYKTSKDYYVKSLTCMRAADGDEISRAITESNLGLVCYKMKNFSESIVHHKICIKALTKALNSEQDYELAYPYNNIGLALAAIGKFSEAINYHNLALDIYWNTFEEPHPDIAMTYKHLAAAYFDSKDYKEAIAQNKQAIEIYKKLFTERHIAVAASYHDLAQAFSAYEDHRSALIYHKKELEIKQELKDSNPHHLYEAFLNIANDLFKGEEMQEAIENYQICIKYMSEYMTNETELETMYTRIGYCYYVLNNFDKALENFQKSYDILSKDSNNGESLNEIREFIGKVFEAKGEIPRAMKYFRRSTDSKIEKHGEDHIDSANALQDLGKKHQENEIFKEAIECYGRSLSISDKLQLKDQYNNSRDSILSCYEQIKDKAFCIFCMVKIETDPIYLECGHALHSACMSRKYRNIKTCTACQELEKLYFS